MIEPKKICLFTWTMAFGGLELHTIALSRFLTQRGHDVSVIALGDDVFSSRLAKESNARVVHRPTSKPHAKISFHEASRLFRDTPADVCIFEKGSFANGSFAFDIAARLRFKKYVTVEQLEAAALPKKTTRQYFGGLVPGLGLWWHRLRLAGYLRSYGPEKIICVSHAVRQRLLNQYWFPSRKTIVACNGVNISRFKRDHERRTEIRTRWGCGANSIVFGAVGRLGKVKGYDRAIQCLKQVREQNPDQDVWLVLVGEGPEETALRELAKRLAVNHRIVFEPFNSTPWIPLSGFDAFVLPSHNEGLPFALLEAMSCQCYPIAMSVGGVAEVLSDPNVGALVEAGNTQAFLSAMNKFLQLPQDVKDCIGRNARERVTKAYDESTQLETIAQAVGA